MNLLTVWNDCPPLNCRELIDYAHSRGVRVLLGFHWGWGLADLDLGRDEDRHHIRKHVLKNYAENYRHLGMDGIYFQTITEHDNLETGGRSTAELACDLVNETAADLWDTDPDLYIQFGLHATSIRERYTDLEPLDNRVTIAWEDAGLIPYSYAPVVKAAKAKWLGTLDETVEYSKRLATFRPGTEFAMVPKGWLNIRWGEDFEHHGPFVLGERSRAFIRRRLEERRPLWDRRNAHWLRYYPAAARFYREILDCRPPTMTVTGLVEDAMFEEEIQPAVALFAETIWNPKRSDDDILKRAMSPCCRKPS
jgi:hypothetical protein